MKKQTDSGHSGLIREHLVRPMDLCMKTIQGIWLAAVILNFLSLFLDCSLGINNLRFWNWLGRNSPQSTLLIPKDRWTCRCHTGWLMVWYFWSASPGFVRVTYVSFTDTFSNPMFKVQNCAHNLQTAFCTRVYHLLINFLPQIKSVNIYIKSYNHKAQSTC